MADNAAPASVMPVPGQPGVYVNQATGEVFKLVEFYDGEKYDVETAASSITVGTKLNFFQNITNKNEIDTNMDTQHKLSSGETMVIKRVGVGVPLARGNNLVRPEDVKKLIFNGYLEAKINRVLIAEGPLYYFPEGYGLTGQTNENNQGIVANGVASTAAKRELEKQHFITDDHTIKTTIEYQDRAWDTNSTNLSGAAIVLNAVAHLRVAIGGLISNAATK